MNIDDNLNKISNELISSGSNIPYMNDLLNNSKSIISLNKSLEETLTLITKSLSESTKGFLNIKNDYDINVISGISSCIYLPDYFDNGEFKVKIIGGNKNRFNGEKIDENTLFDVASISKLYMLTLLFSLSEQGLINLDDRIAVVNSTYKLLDDFTFNDLIRLHGEICTNGRINSANNMEEAYDILSTAYLKSNDRTTNKYTDIGAIIMSNTLEKIISEKLGKKMSFEEIMNEYLFNKLELNHTTYNPKTTNISGNGSLDGKVHDPKARILGGAVGSAGIFVNSDDLSKLSKTLFSENFLSESEKKRYGEITFPDSKFSNKGNLGIYVKHKNGLDSSYTPGEFSTGSFSHQGWTGSVATFDPNNLIHQNILVNAIYKNEDEKQLLNDKPIGFKRAFNDYQIEQVKKTMLIYIVKKYYNEYLNIKEDINQTIKL